MFHSFYFWFGLVLGLVAGGFIVGFYLNNIHSSKIKAVETKVDTVVSKVDAVAAAVKKA